MIEQVPAARERWLGAVVQGAPLLGLPICALRIYAIDSHDHADYDSTGTFFASGLFMMAAGLLVALAARFVSRSPWVRAHAASALRFQLWVLGICVVLVALAALPMLLDLGPFTLDHQPAGLMAAVFLTGLSFGVVLPLIETGRALVLAFRALRREPQRP